VKSRADLPALAFQREAEGLAWLAEAAAVRIPRVVATSEGSDPGFLALERIEPGPRSPASEERLGRELAALHRAGAPSFGLADDNFLATLPQDNRPLTDWASFYRERRLRPLLDRARARGLVGRSLSARFDALFARMPQLVGPEEPPARLHGDLWGGNWLVDAAGTPHLIDPAVYGGHREIDLAMMRLFGGFGRRVFDAYEEAAPLAPGAEERVELYQLYPLLAHVVMFGGGYVGQLESALAAYV
jgi:fructosamine-3-kinase